MSYQGNNEDKEKVISALGGKRGLIDSGFPAILFLVVFGKNSTSLEKDKK